MSDHTLLLADLMSAGVRRDLVERVARALEGKVRAAKAPAHEHPRFAEFWAEYPQRAGTNSRKNASARFSRAVEKGEDPGVIIDGARRYREQLIAYGRLKTDLVKQAETWLNGEYWTNGYDERPAAPATRLGIIAEDLQRRGRGTLLEPGADGRREVLSLGGGGADRGGPRGTLFG